MTDITQYATQIEAVQAAEAAYIAAHPEPVKPPKAFSISRPVVIMANSARLWIEVRQDEGWRNVPNDPTFALRSHTLPESATMEKEEIKALIEQLMLKLTELEAGEAWKESCEVYDKLYRAWSEGKDTAAHATRMAWSKAKRELAATPDPDDYSSDDVEYDEEEYDDEDEEL